MKERVTRPANKDYPTYSRLGMEPAWMRFRAFLADMGVRPSLEHTIDRADTERGYYKGNCRWADKWQQSQNRTCVKINAQVVMIIRTMYHEYEWTQEALAERYGISRQHVSRIVNGRAWGAGDDTVPF